MRCRAILLAFVRQVLLRPVRIGTLVVLGALIAMVVGGAESWWFLLGITLFHAAAATLIVLWVQVPAPPTARPVLGRAGRGCSCVRCPLPRQRRPQPGG